MDPFYFKEFKTGVSNAWMVGLGNWVLSNGLQPVIPVGPAPTTPFRVAITISALPSTGTSPAHEDVTGSVFVNSEELVFTRATRLTNTLELTALPNITATGLDCNILVECISVGGAPLEKETLTPIEIICFPKTHVVKDPSGSGYMQTNYDIYTEAALAIGDLIRYLDPHQGKTIDIYVKNVSSAVDLEYGNTQPFRVYNCA
jgi:hypothetical protein